MDDEERIELAEMLGSAQQHLFRYIDGSARDSLGEMEAARLLIDRVIERLHGDN